LIAQAKAHISTSTISGCSASKEHEPACTLLCVNVSFHDIRCTLHPNCIYAGCNAFLDRAQEQRRKQEQQQQQQQPQQEHSLAPSSSKARALNAERRLQSRQHLPINLPAEDQLQSYRDLAAHASAARRTKEEAKARAEEQLTAAQRAMGHPARPTRNELVSFCKRNSICHTSGASKPALCEAILAGQQPQQQLPQEPQQQPSQQKRRGRPPAAAAAAAAVQQQISPRQGAKKKQLRT